MPDLDSEKGDFESVYKQHVGYVVSGDRSASRADMDPGVSRRDIAGIRLPGRVSDFRILRVRPDAEHMIGETIYVSDGEEIGLRSRWRHDGRWLA